MGKIKTQQKKKENKPCETKIYILVPVAARVIDKNRNLKKNCPWWKLRKVNIYNK